MPRVLTRRVLPAQARSLPVTRQQPGPHLVGEASTLLGITSCAGSRMWAERGVFPSSESNRSSPVF